MIWNLITLMGLISAEGSEEAKPEIKVESRDEAIDRLDRGSVVERLRKAYQPVTIKLEGAWTVQTPAAIETWTYAGGQWKCDGSSLTCADWLPASFKFFGSKAWLSAGGGPKEKSAYDFEGGHRAASERHSSATAEGEEQPGEEQIRFEGKRNALEVWEWNSSSLGSLKVGISLRDYLIEKIVTSDNQESLEWSQRPGAKGLSLEKVFVERGSDKLLFVRK